MLTVTCEYFGILAKVETASDPKDESDATQDHCDNSHHSEKAPAREEQAENVAEEHPAPRHNHPHRAHEKGQCDLFILSTDAKPATCYPWNKELRRTLV